MIAKIKNGINEENNDTQNWRIIDNIKEIVFNHIRTSEFDKWEYQVNAPIENINKCVREFRTKQETIYLTLLSLEYKDGTMETILTDSDCYIMSDDGKTIEKIYGWS